LSLDLARYALIVAGLPLSLGPGYPVTARVTFSRATAAQGGYVFAAPRAAPGDDAAIRLSAAVLTGRAGALGPAGTLSRRHGVPALSLAQARWEPGALVLSVPVFGAPQGGVRPVERMEERRISEGDAVSVDPEDGLLTLIDPARQETELALSQALRGFDGLKDLQGLLQWYDARTQDAPDPRLAARLVEELAARLAAGTATEAEFTRLRRAVDAGLDASGRAVTAEASARSADRHLRALADRLEDLTLEAGEAGSAAAARRLAAEGRRSIVNARALSAAVGSPALAKPVEQAAQRLTAAADRRAASLSGRAQTPEQALAAAGVSQAAGAELPPSLYERFVADNGLSRTLEDISGDASLDLRHKDERLAAVFRSTRLSADSGAGREIAALLPKAAELSVCGPEGCVERVPASGALDAVKSAWAMSWSAAALGRRKRAGEPFRAPALRATAFVPADAGGFAWSRDPVGGSLRRLVVQAVKGEPDALEAGRAPGDEYWLDRRTLEPALPVITAGASPAITLEQAKQAARAARALDDALGEGVKLTFAFQDGRLFVRSWASAAKR
jgi:hypothetical protein